jgi:hypothetical protein
MNPYGPILGFLDWSLYFFFQKYYVKILLGDFNAKEGREDIFKPTIGNESLHDISNDNGITVVTLPH